MAESGTVSIRILETDEELRDALPVLRELRPHLNETTFLTRVHAASAEKFQFVALFKADAPVCVAGYRVVTSLNAGATLYVDDLVTATAHRRQGFAHRLFAFICAEGKRLGCTTLSLDSNDQRRDAHEFYRKQGMVIAAQHFAMKL